MAASELVLDTFKGLVNNKPEHNFDRKELAVALNVDIDNSNTVSRRAGYARVLSASAPHSGWANRAEDLFLFVQGSALQSLNTSLSSVTTLRSDLTPGLPMSYWEHDGRVYFTNGAQTGAVEHGAARTWGLQPPSAPALSSGSGVLPQGTYQVCCTFIAVDGQESGASGVTVAIVAGGITATLPASSDPRVTAVRLYCSTPDGTTMYDAGTYPNGTAAATIGASTINLQRPLQTQFLGPPPAGQLCWFFRGRMYVAVGNLLYASVPFGLELFDPADFLAFDDVIAVGAPCVDGLFISTGSETLWLQGNSSEDFAQAPRHGYGAVPGTLAYFPAGRIAESGTEIHVPVWLSKQGVVTGLPGGQLVNRTKQWDFEAPARGAGLFRRSDEGLYQYIVTFTGA